VVAISIGKEEPIVLEKKQLSAWASRPRVPRPHNRLCRLRADRPENNYDDLAGLDLRGKVVLLLSGGHRKYPASARALSEHALGSIEATGVIGVISIQNPIGRTFLGNVQTRAAFGLLSLAEPGLEENAGSNWQ